MFRLETEMDSVFGDLKRSLDDYVVWYSRKFKVEPFKLRHWADAVFEKCHKNWQFAVLDGKSVQQKPSGYPGLRRSITEAQKDVVFLHDDRAPHGLVLVCKIGTKGKWLDT